MKEMIYGYEQKTEILYEGHYKGYHFLIVSYGTHPCAYVELPKEHKWYGKDYNDIDVDCHWGLTFGDDLDHVLGEEGKNKFFIGWDYAHCGDYNGFNEHPRFLGAFSCDGKKWTTKEIYSEVKKVIRQL